MDLSDVFKQLGSIESQLTAFSTKAAEEIKLAGSASAESKAALEQLGNQQKDLAGRLLELEQKGVKAPTSVDAPDDWGQQFTKSEGYKAFVAGGAQKARLEVKNTLTGSDTNVAPDRKPGVVGGAFNTLTLESLYISLPTSSNAIEYTRENAFTNSAAEAAEGAAKAESSLTWALVNQPVSTVAHWIKISRQLAADNAALAAYVNLRMRYGVQLRVENQLAVGDGVAPNMAGFMKAGNYVAHGYANAALGATLKKCVLIRKVMADLWMAGYPADAIVMNAVEWAGIEIDLMTTAAGQTLLSVNEAGQPRLFGVPVVQTVGMANDTFAVGNFAQHGTIYNREGVVVEMSESDSDNFTKNLVTLRAERRLALATERPAAIRGGDLTPA